MSAKLNKTPHASGYTLLEVIISLSVLVVGIISILTLAVGSLSTTVSALDYLVAANLAREGVELVRNQRDTNWYKGNSFDFGLTNDAYFTAVIDYNDIDASKNLVFAFVPNNIDSSACRLKRSAGGVYTRDTGANTDYYRLIYLNNVCQNLSADPIVPGNETVKENGADCSPLETKIGIDIVSKVKWTTKENPKTVELRDRVYNWR